MEGSTGKFKVLLGLGAVFVLALALACGSEKVVEVVKEVVVEKEVIREVPVQVVVEKEVIRTVEVPGETVVVEKEVVRTVEVAGETIVVEKEVVRTVEVPGETVVVEVVKQVEVPGETIVVEKEVVKTVEIIKEVAVQVEVVKIVEVEVTAQPKGEFAVAWTRLDPLVQLYSLDNNSSVGQIGVDFQVYEGLFTTQLLAPDVIPSQEIYVPAIAQTWTVAQDLSKITFTINRGIPWHNGWGELKAEDVVWTYNNSFEEGSINNAAESVPPGHKAGWDLKDEYTAVQNVKVGEFSAVWGVWQGGLGHLDGTYGMVCKHCYESMGEEKFLQTPVGTGAYKVVKWVGHDELVVEAVLDHWQQTGTVNTVRAYELPEEATKIAALLTGEVDFAQIPAKRLPEVMPDTNGGTAVPMGMPWPQTIYMSGNYWSKWCPDCPEGEQDLVARRDGFLPGPENPWIGDPFAEGCDYENISSLQTPPPSPPCPEMENARLVRLAMSMAVDRQSILDNVLGGYGTLSYTHLQSQFPPGTALHMDEWIVPFNPELAREHLATAGYPDGFKLTFWSSDDLANLWDPEVSAAIAEMWRKNLNLDVTLDRTAYSARRPEAVRKEMFHPWMQGWGLPPGSSKAISMCANPGIVSGIELPEKVCDVGFAPDKLPDLDDRIAANVSFNNYLSYWSLMPSFVQIPGYWVHNPTIAEWNPYWGPIWNNPVSVRLAK